MISGTHQVRVLDLGDELHRQVSTAPRTRRDSVHRDRHRHGSRGALAPAILPRYRTRRESFDDLMIQEVRSLVTVCSDFSAIKYRVEDVPPSDPAPWERDAVVLFRGFGADPHHGLDPQAVVYHRPLERRARSVIELRKMIHAIILEESAHLLDKHPEDIDPSW